MRATTWMRRSRQILTSRRTRCPLRYRRPSPRPSHRPPQCRLRWSVQRSSPLLHRFPSLLWIVWFGCHCRLCGTCRRLALRHRRRSLFRRLPQFLHLLRVTSCRCRSGRTIWICRNITRRRKHLQCRNRCRRRVVRWSLAAPWAPRKRRCYQRQSLQCRHRRAPNRCGMPMRLHARFRPRIFQPWIPACWKRGRRCGLKLPGQKQSLLPAPWPGVSLWLQAKMACKALQMRRISYRKQSICCRKLWVPRLLPPSRNLFMHQP